jgi:hypothetical protein
MRAIGYAVSALVVLMLAFGTWHWLSLPPLVRGPDGKFGARVLEKFPVGTIEVNLVRELRNQGFHSPVQAHDLSYRNSATGEEARIRVPDPSLRYSTFSSFSFPCEVTWWVLWHADQVGKVTDIRGDYGRTCP